MCNEACIRSWINDGPTLDTLKAVEDFGRNLNGQGLTTSQIRQVFTRCKSIEAKEGIEKNKREFLMLKPYLAYAAKRHGAGVNALRGVLDLAINQVLQGSGVQRPGDEQARFKNFCSLFEAILAYHRAAGGK